MTGPSPAKPELCITGIGVTTPIGQGRDSVQRALLNGDSAFGVMQRPGRQKGTSTFLGAELASLWLPDELPHKSRRGLSWSAQVAVATAAEAWSDARLEAVDAERIGLIVGGSNLQQRELVLAHEAYRERLDFLRPAYGQTFMDSDIAALCSEVLGIRGAAHTVGGASASGHLAIIQAIHCVLSGQLDACIALGALLDLSYFECQALRSMGAMGSDRFAHDPGSACRPFDADHDGFIYGENCGAVVIELAGQARREPYAYLRGWSYLVNADRSPEPSLDAEVKAIGSAIASSGLAAKDFDYINPHGTGSQRGDEVELEALRICGLSGARINATKSILGHGLSAAGTVEVIVTLLQMQAGQLHPTRNLERPLDPGFRWVRQEACQHRIRNAVNLSFGFGGINSAICLSSAS